MQTSLQIFINVEILSFLTAHLCPPSKQSRRLGQALGREMTYEYECLFQTLSHDKGYGDEFKTSDGDMHSCMDEIDLKWGVRNGEKRKG